MSKKNKFDLTALVHHGVFKEGEKVVFVSDAAKSAVIAKQPNGEFKLIAAGKTYTVHGLAQEWLGQEPPQHASKWFKKENGKTFYDYWQEDIAEAA